MSARWLVPVAIAVLGAFLAVGFVGVDRYGRNYWLYRGFPPPHDPAYVREQGNVEQIKVTSSALGGRSQSVYVYLPHSGWARSGSSDRRDVAGHGSRSVRACFC